MNIQWRVTSGEWLVKREAGFMVVGAGRKRKLKLEPQDPPSENEGGAPGETKSGPTLSAQGAERVGHPVEATTRVHFGGPGVAQFGRIGRVMDRARC